MNRSSPQSFRNPKVYNLPFEPPKKQKAFKYWKPILLLLMIMGLYILFVYSNYFKIKNIIVADDLPPAVSEYLQKYKGSNIFRLHSGEIRSDLLAQYPELTDLNVIKGIPDSIKVSFNERTPKLVWQSGPKKYLVDENGIAYKEITDPGELIVCIDNHNLSVSSNGQVVTSVFINFLTSVDEKLEQNGLAVDHFEVSETTFQTDAITENGLKLKFDITRTVESQISDLVKFLEEYKDQPTEYIDLRVEGKVFYK